MSKTKSIVFQLKFVDLLNKPFPNLYHEVRESGTPISVSKSDSQGHGTPISRPPSTILVVHIRHPLTKEMIKVKSYISVPAKEGKIILKAPFSIQAVKLRELAENAGSYKRSTHKVTAGKDEYEVKKGQDLYTIAKMHDTTWQILAQLNKSTIKDPDKIVPGQFIKVPPTGSSLTGNTNERPDSLTSQTHYKVKKGETLSSISQRSGVSVEQLQRMNGITNPTTLQASQTIKLRSDGSAQTHTTPKPTPTARLTPKQSSKPSSSDEDEGFFGGPLESIEDVLEGINDAMSGGKNDKPAGGAPTAGTDSNSNASSTSGGYTVKSGDTLSDIAKKHGVNTNDLARTNGLKLTDTIHPGQKLKIPTNGANSSSTGSSSQSSRTDRPVNVTTKPSNSSDGTPKDVATTNGACTCKVHNLFWSAKVSCEFRKKVIEICQDLWPNNYLAMANNLMALMHLETEGSFDPSKVNSLGFVGLVQMGADVRKDLGVSSDKLRNMSAVEQLDWVKKYFQLYNNRYKKIDSFLEMYLTILRPKSVKPEGIDINENEIIFKDNGQTSNNPYKQNPAFMKEKGEWKVRGFSGGVTYAWEVKKEIAHHYDNGKKSENRFFKSTCSQVVQPPITSNPVESAPWMEIAIREARQWAGYHETKSKSNSKSGSKGVITDNYHKLVGVVIGGNKPYTPNLTTAWCASFINYCLKEKKYAYAKDPSSQFPTKYPEKFIKISKPVYGAIVVYKHTNREYGTGHVALVYAKLNNGDYAVLGGNQGESITLNTHKGVYLDSLKCKFVGYYIPKSYKSIADSLIQNNSEFIKTVSLSEAKKSLNDPTGVTLTTK
ncbi:LysM peptidoglycan-binding domain-containing protein [Psychrobacter aquimaris]|uniref:LysM peptidoglycan-binding domain-containing protein n=1 Tax=Psychrobacter aquimaris TaxID=292733 RepID=UPI003FD1FAFE